jgi:16S rRNA (cytosine1402-N4)-methyltransferase
MDYHYPVLSKESVNQLDIQEGGIYIDATLGNGGHTLLILEKGGIVYGIDQDPKNLDIATQRIKETGLEKNFFPVHSNFNKITEIIDTKIHQKVDGLIVDLGLSSNQQKSKDRGFSFNDATSLDMRLDPENQEVTAEMIINTASYDDLYKVFSKLGQEVYSKPIIQRIIRERQKSPIKSGERLANIVRDFYKEKHIKSKIDPSTKIFLSLRIVVNNEFENLRGILKDSLKVVKPGGTVCIITFHSGEDRIVKQFIKTVQIQNQVSGASKPIKPTFEEITQNPLSRSATLRSYKIV